jgi:four helix bundle protein
VYDQLDRACTSIVLNLAEGNGKFTGPDRCRFFDMARGSALECTAGLDVLVAKGRCTLDEVGPGKQRLVRIVSMLVGLIKANSGYRLHEREGGED